MKSAIKKIFVLFIVAIIFILLLEIGLRLYNSIVHKENFFGSHPSLFIPDEKIGFKLNPKLRIKGLTQNNQSFRADKDYELKSDKRRIICAGGSTTYGTGVPDYCTYPYFLGKISGYEVINAGAPGYHTYHQRLRMDEFLKYNINDLILYVGHNDILNYLDNRDSWTLYSTDVGGVVTQPSRHGIYRFFKALKERSVIALKLSDLVWNFLARRKNARVNMQKKEYSLDDFKDEKINQKVIDYFKENCTSIIEACLKNNVRAVFVKQAYFLNPKKIDEEWLKEKEKRSLNYKTYAVYSYLIPKYLLEIWKALDELKETYKDKIVVLDFNDYFFAKAPYEDRNRFFIDVVHLGCDGNRMLAEYISNNLPKN